MERVWVQLELTKSARRFCKIASVLAPGASSPTLTDESGVFYFNFELQNNLKNRKGHEPTDQKSTNIYQTYPVHQQKYKNT